MTDTDMFGESIEGAKCISVKSGHGTQVLLTLVRVNGGKNPAADSRGYRGGYDFIIVADAGREQCYTNIHEMKRDHHAVDEGDAIYNLVEKVGFDEVGYDELIDGHTYTPEEVESM